MSVVIHQDAIDKLAQAPGLRQFIEEKAQAMVASTQESVRQYFWRANVDVDQDVKYSMLTEGAIVGIAPGEDYTKAERIAEGEDHLKKWLRAAVEDAGFRPA